MKSLPPKRKSALLGWLKRTRPEPGDPWLARILCGEVRVNGVVERNPKALVPLEAEILWVPRPYVSRGGYKLAGAFAAWPLDVRGKVILDAGAATGGFTDVLLQQGARLVYAVDVGKGLLHSRLQTDPRVVNLEGHNYRHLPPLEPAPEGVVADLSFTRLAPAVGPLLGLASEGWLVALVKPQFEVGPDEPDFQGVLSETRSQEVLLAVLEQLSRQGVQTRAWRPADLKGQKGNQEYLVWLERT